MYRPSLPMGACPGQPVPMEFGRYHAVFRQQPRDRANVPSSAQLRTAGLSTTRRQQAASYPALIRPVIKARVSLFCSALVIVRLSFPTGLARPLPTGMGLFWGG